MILLLATAFIVILTRLNRGLARAKRAAEESSRMKGVFIRNITHEINTPLNAIVGFAELASTTPDDEPERSSYIDIIRENSGYLQKLIDDVLYIADIESSEAPPSRAAVEVDTCCRRCIDELSKHAPLATEIASLRRGRPVAPHPHLVPAAEQGAHRTAAQRRAVHRSQTGRRTLLFTLGGRAQHHLRGRGRRPRRARRGARTHLRTLRQTRLVQPGPRARTGRLAA